MERVMGCPNEEKLLLTAAGEVSSRKRTRILGHIEGCDRCRREYEVARRAVRIGFPALENPPDRGKAAGETRVGEILAAVRTSGSPSRVRTLGPRRPRRLRPIAVAAAAAVILAALMARYLGEWDAARARFDPIRGAHLRSTEDPALRRVEVETELSPGDLVVGLDDSRAGLRWPDGGELMAVGRARLVAGRGGTNPSAYLAEGVFIARSGKDEPLTLSLGETVVRIHGRAELSAAPASQADAQEWAEARARELRDPSQAGASSKASIAGRIHVLEGRVEGAGGGIPPLSAGEEALTGPGSFRDVAWVGTATFYEATAAGLLSESELGRVRQLLPAGRDAIGALADAAADEDLAESERCLALWLLGKIGDRSSRSIVGRIADSLEPPPAVRATAWHTRALLGDWGAVNMEALREESAGADPENPVVAEAICQALRRSPDADVPEALAAFAAERGRPASLRSLAAVTASSLEIEIPASTIESILAEPDGLDGWALLSRIVDARDPTHQRLLLELAREDSPILAPVFSRLAGNRIPGAEDRAVAALQGSTEPALLLGAAHYLGSVRDPRLPPLVRALLDSADASRRLAGIHAARWLSESELPGRNEDLQRVLRDPTSSTEAIVTAFAGLKRLADRAATLERAVSTDSLIRNTAQEALPGIVHGDPEFERSPEYREILLEMTGESSTSTRSRGWQELGRVAPEFAVDLVGREIERGFEVPPTEFLGALDAAIRTGELSSEDLARAVEITRNLLVARRGADSLIACLTTLGFLNEADSPEARLLLTELLDDPGYPPAVPILAAKSLAWDPAPVRRAEALARMLDRGDDASRALAHSLLSNLGGEKRRRLGRALAGLVGSRFGRGVAVLLAPGGPAAATEFLRPGPDDLSRLLLATSAIPENIEEHRSALTELLDRDDPAIRRLAAQRLAVLTAPAPELALLTEDRDPIVRLAALSSRMKGASAAEAEVLIRRIGDCLREEACEKIANQVRTRIRASRELEPELLRLARSAGAGELATRLAGSILVHPGLRELGEEASLETRLEDHFGAAHSAAGRRDDAEGVLFARRVLDGRDDGSEKQAIIALRLHGGRVDIPTLIREFRRSTSVEVRNEAEKALGWLVGLSPGRLRRDPDAIGRWWETRRYAVEVPIADSPVP